MLPRKIFEVNSAQTLLCGCEDLDHLNDYIALQQELHLDNSETTLGISEDDTENTSKNLFHALACSIVDPLEFKEVKMLATEALAKFPLPIVLPFVFAYLICFVREMNPHGERSTSSIVNDENIPDSCGLVTAKLMVYYLNRVFSEDDRAYKDGDISSRALVVLIQILGIQSGEDSTDASLLTDLQRGCIDCIAILLLKLAAEDIAQDRSKSWTTSTSSLVNLLLSWIFGTESDEKLRKLHYPEELYFRVQTLLESEWSEAQYRELPLQVRICCCNILVR
ncbi:unnamed protein product [Phytophthora lilii]|uniref:Unnamed protein product n=1 Tax=Phytophthora lilii TaxID=2077276 RepID=A0A9W6TDM0_9STRA|nr:unnamed protein product [Phytophthora lilii]